MWRSLPRTFLPASSDPEREAEGWAKRLAEVDRKRSGFQDMAAEGLIALDEVRTKLAALEEARDTARRELSTLETRREGLRRLERDRDMLMERYAGMAPGALDGLGPEERHRVYKLLKLRVGVHLDGTLEASGVLGEAPEVCNPGSIS
jgi:flagellar motility protein MotE (MotC chaperone)